MRTDDRGWGEGSRLPLREGVGGSPNTLGGRFLLIDQTGVVRQTGVMRRTGVIRQARVIRQTRVKQRKRDKRIRHHCTIVSLFPGATPQSGLASSAAVARVESFPFLPVRPARVPH